VEHFELSIECILSFFLFFFLYLTQGDGKGCCEGQCTYATSMQVATNEARTTTLAQPKPPATMKRSKQVFTWLRQQRHLWEGGFGHFLLQKISCLSAFYCTGVYILANWFSLFSWWLKTIENVKSLIIKNLLKHDLKKRLKSKSKVLNMFMDYCLTPFAFSLLLRNNLSQPVAPITFQVTLFITIAKGWGESPSMNPSFYMHGSAEAKEAEEVVDSLAPKHT